MVEIINSIITQYGVTDWGVCDFSALPQLLPCRGKSRLPAYPQSVIVMLFPYYVPVPATRNVALYAVSDDYHKVVGGILENIAAHLSHHMPGETFVPFVDSSPIPEKSAARLAGLGAIGRHGLLIHPDYGAYVFIGTVVTGKKLPASPPSQTDCLDCGACISACPTTALHWDKPLDQQRCRSAITQKKGELSPWEQNQVRLGGMVWGCDICQEVCPLHKHPVQSPIAAFHENLVPYLEPEYFDALLTQKAYGYRPKEVLLRNYNIVYGNHS